MENSFSVSGFFSGEFDETELEKWSGELRNKLQAESVSLGLVFMTPDWFSQSDQVLDTLRLSARIPLLMGCSSTSLIADHAEIENTSGLVLALYHLPGAELEAVHIEPSHLTDCITPEEWHRSTGIHPDATNGWLVFADPFSMNCEAWLDAWNTAYRNLPIVGGLASGEMKSERTQLFLNDRVYEEGGVAISVGGNIRLASVISQGCTPIGETWTITKTQGNVILEIGNRPAYQVLENTVGSLNEVEQKKLQGNLFVGLVINEYLDEFHRGDFLIRNLIGADPNSGALAVGAIPHTGQTIQFQRRDANAATEDMNELLNRARQDLDGTTIYGGSLYNCNGRGKGLFGTPNHDASMIQDCLGPVTLSGFFCNGELGPVGARNFLHGYTASLALFVEKRKNDKIG